MDYKDRPLEDRKDLATQYAAFLMAENKPNREIISILKSDYALSYDEAVQAFEAARSNYNVPAFDKVDKKLLLWAGLCILFIGIFSYASFSFKPLKGNEIATINDCVVAAPITKERTVGKNPRHYYVIWLRGRILPCHFFDNYYNYSDRQHELDAIHEGDTISVQILKEDLDIFYERNNFNIVELININRGDGFLVDHASRYAQIKGSQRTVIYVLLTVFGIIVLVLIIRICIYFTNHR